MIQSVMLMSLFLAEGLFAGEDIPPPPKLVRSRACHPLRYDDPLPTYEQVMRMGEDSDDEELLSENPALIGGGLGERPVLHNVELDAEFHYPQPGEAQQEEAAAELRSCHSLRTCSIRDFKCIIL